MHGVIDLKAHSSLVHRILDPIWKRGKMKRREVYMEVARALGREEYHTAEIASVDEARAVYEAVVEVRKRLGLTRKMT